MEKVCRAIYQEQVESKEMITNQVQITDYEVTTRLAGPKTPKLYAIPQFHL